MSTSNPIEKMITKLEDTLDPILDPKAKKIAQTMTEDEVNLLQQTTLVLTQCIALTKGALINPPTENFKKVLLERCDTFEKRHTLLCDTLEAHGLSFQDATDRKSVV